MRVQASDGAGRPYRSHEKSGRTPRSERSAWIQRRRGLGARVNLRPAGKGGRNDSHLTSPFEHTVGGERCAVCAIRTLVASRML